MGTRCLLIALVALVPVGSAAGMERQDPYFGEARYHAYQERYFEALERLDTEIRQHYGVDEPELDSLYPHIDHAEFSVGDFELYYRMHHQAGRAIQAVLESHVEEPVRNKAAFRLAKIHFEKDQPRDALLALDEINGQVPEEIRDDVNFLRANIYLATGRPADAVDVLEGLTNSKDLNGFSRYNLGIALLQDGRPQEAIEALDKAGRLAAGDRAGLAIRDKSNLVLGTILFESADFERAKQSLDRVRLEGPFSNQALLRAGWAETSAEQHDRALVPWNILVDREPTDVAVQEAMLAVPHAYANLKLYGRAALIYGRALELFSNQIEKVDASIDSIKEGRFLKALIREDSREDQSWVIRLRSLPGAPETYYLMELMASHDFQTALHNYLDLEELRSKLMAWQTGLEAFDDIIRLREQNYEPLLPEVDTEFRELDSRIRLRVEQHKMLVQRRDDLLTTPRPEFLATREEQAVLKRIERIETKLQASISPVDESTMARVNRLKGLLTWTLETEYHDRLTEFDRNLRGLDNAMAVVKAQYDQYVRARQAATHSYAGYEVPIDRLRAHVSNAVERVDLLMARQGHLLEVVAIEELVARRDHLENYGDKARFALADSYDRATQAQAKIGED